MATQHPRDRSRNMVALLLVMVHPAAIFCAFARLRLYHVMNSGMLLRVFAAGFVLSIFAASHEKVTQFILLHLTMGHSNLDKAIGATAFAGGPYSVGASLAFFVILSFGTTAFVEEVFKLGTSTSRVLLYGVGNQYSSDAALTAGRRRQRAMSAVSLAVAGASGFATIENIVYCCRAYENSTHTFGSLAYWNMALYRLVVVATLHVICGILTGTNLARRDLIMTRSHGRDESQGMILRCAVPAILLHGSYNLMVNILHAKELQNHVHHSIILWAVGSLALAAGLYAVKLSGIALQNELRGNRREGIEFV